MSVSLDAVRQAKPQLGEFDPNILCAECDGKLGRFDEYAIDICSNFQSRHIPLPNRMFELPGFDGDRFAKFVLATLWRASISERKSFAEIKLGPYENISRDVLFGARPLTDLTPFQVIVLRYRSPHLDMKGMYTLPRWTGFMGLNCYGFMLSGLRIVAKLDKRPFNKELRELVINSRNTMRGCLIEFEKTGEFKELKMIAVNDLRRQAGRRQ